MSQVLPQGVYWVIHHGPKSPWLVVLVPQSDAPEVHVGRFRSLAAAKRGALLHAGRLFENPATPTARRFVAAKIRKLRREGKPERAAVGEALAMGRRRGFRSIPKRRRGNPTTTVTPGNLKSECRVIGEQLNVLRYVHKYLMEHNAAGVAADVAGAVYALDELRAQASMGLHKNPRRRANPVLGLIANESPAVFTVSKRVKEIVYIHAQDGEEYVHPFAPGVSATFLQDGRCVLWRRDGKPVGGRRIGNTIRPIGG